MNFQLSNTFSTTCTLENLESLFDDPMLDDTSAEDDLLWNNREITLSPPTVIIPSSSSTSNNTNTTTSSMSNVYSDDRSFAVGRPALMINLPANSSSGAAFSYTTRSVDDDVNIHNNYQQQQQAIVAPPQAPGSPRTPRLALDITEVLQSWNAITSNNNVNTPIDIEHHVKELLDQLQNSNTNTTTTPCNNNNNNNLNIMNNMMNNNTTFINNNNHQDYLGSIIASGTPFHSPMRARPQYHHTKSPSLGSTTQSRGIKKGTRERSNSCFQSIQSYSNSKMQSFGNSSSVPTNNNNNMLMMNSSMMNMNGGLNSPSVTSTCSSNVTVSPANVSTNSFGIMMNNGPQGYMSNNNNNQVIVNNNQQVTMTNSSSKKGKIPANRQDKNNQSHLAYQQHSKGLLVEATPNDKPIKMQQCKLVDGGIRIQIEDGISKNRKDTGLQFHTCTFK